MQTAVKIVEPGNRKLAQPITILGLAGDQDYFLAFGVAGFCHAYRRLGLDLLKSLSTRCGHP
jgi:hypothetical protein